MSLELVSLTGADDDVAISDLLSLSEKFNFAELAILYFREKEGAPRNPSPFWREKFLAAGLPFTAAHLCGAKVFREILDSETSNKNIADISRYGRVQLNINAKNQDFTQDEVLSIYKKLHQAGIKLILQYHDQSKPVIELFLDSLSNADKQQVHILFDGSRGKGRMPDQWDAPVTSGDHQLFCGYAGGLGPETLSSALPLIFNASQSLGHAGFWIDMESGVRTDNRFDLDKATKVLSSCVSEIKKKDIAGTSSRKI